MKNTLLVAGLLLAGPALAEESTLWGETGNWSIYIDPTLENGCFALVGYQDDSFFRAGYDNTDDSTYIFFSDPDWASLVAGNTYGIRVYFDPVESYWDADALASEFADGTKYLSLTSTDATLMDDVMKATTARVEFNGKEIASFDLTGSGQALAKTVQCQDDAASAGGTAGSTTDPFAKGGSSGGTNKTDPFAN